MLGLEPGLPAAGGLAALLAVRGRVRLVIPAHLLFIRLAPGFVAPIDALLVRLMNYREVEAITVSCFAERMENIRRLSAYDSDAFSTGLYSPRSKGILSEYLDCPINTMVWAALTSLGAV